MDPLARYIAKRDFSRTPEPAPALDEDVEGDGWFVVQKHAARRLHYDLRLAIGGVLVSWAVTRGPSFDPKDRRLAVRTEDHPLSYGAFEGTIPKGEYGGGTVMLWDHGTYEVEGDPAEALAEGHMKATFTGARLRGRFKLVRMKPEGSRENWLLIKDRDALADPSLKAEDWDRSVMTGRRMDAIAEGAPAERHDPPPFRPPMLAGERDSAPEGEDWLHETKFDGYRMLAAVAGPAVRCHTRNGRDWTERFASLAAALSDLGLGPSLLDGEVVAAGAGGQADFSSLQAALGDGGPLGYVIFDAQVLDGEDIRALPLLERKERLGRRLDRLRPPLALADHVRGHGAEVEGLARAEGAEGIVSKRAASRYRNERSRDWVKVRFQRRRAFRVAGWSPSSTPRPFASLILADGEPGALRYAGRVGTGFDAARMEEVAGLLRGRERKTPPCEGVPAELRRKARWVEPDLAVEVEFTEFTAAGHVRHASFQGIVERPDGNGRPAGQRETRRQAAAQRWPAPEPKVRLTNPGRVLFPGSGLTKRGLAAYLSEAWERMAPYLADRPVSLVRCPGGIAGSCFFQKHPMQGAPEGMGFLDVPKERGTERYIALPTREALVACAQIGALEIHLWGARIDRIERPDRLVLDLDPGEGVDFDEVRRAASGIRPLLAEAGLESRPMLTGGKGVHVIVPLARVHDWADVSGFAEAFARKVAALDPSRFTAVSRLSERPGRIYVDWLRNKRGATAICPWSPRARKGAPVAVPVSWERLAEVQGADAFAVADPPFDIGPEEMADPAPQRITKAGRARIGL